MLDGDDVLMVAARLADVDDLNRRARTVLRARGPARSPTRSCSPDAPSPTATTSSPCATTTGSACSTAPEPPSTASTPTPARSSPVTDNGERLVVPFAYAAAGHLTHGYATTIHKAQGATVDRCFVLVDDTTSREHAYTALSRGRHGNDLFVVAADRRSEERHAAEVQPDPLDGLRAAVQRSSAQRFALDELQAGSTSQLEQLRRERDLLRARLSQRPPDPSWDVRTLTEERRQRTARPRRRLPARDALSKTSTDSAPSAGAPTPQTPRDRRPHRPLRCRDRPTRRQARRSRPPTRSTRSGRGSPHDLGAPARRRAAAAPRPRPQHRADRATRPRRHTRDSNEASKEASASSCDGEGASCVMVGPRLLDIRQLQLSDELIAGTGDAGPDGADRTPADCGGTGVVEAQELREHEGGAPVGTRRTSGCW